MNAEGMKIQIDKLVELQGVTTETIKMSEILERVEEKTTALDHRIEASAAQREEQKGLIASLKKQYRELESEIHITESHIKKLSEKRVSVKTNREYKALLKEEDQLKRHQSKMEDQMLVLLDEIESAEKVLADIEAGIVEVEQQVAEEKGKIFVEAAQSRERLDGLNGQLEILSEKIEPKLLSTFNTVKGKQAKGIVMVPVTDANCGGCNVNIPPQMYNELQRCDSIRFCPNCQRILYWQPVAEPKEN
jgi:predicted  nucleic acid-binding Zn-ribbon protein